MLDTTKRLIKVLCAFLLNLKYVALSPTKHRNTLNLGNEVLLESTHESTLLLEGLESTVAELGRSIDPLELDLLGGPPAGLRVQGLAQGHDTLLDTGDGALNHDEVVLDLTVVDEATHTRELLALNSIATRNERIEHTG